MSNVFFCGIAGAFNVPLFRRMVGSLLVFLSISLGILQSAAATTRVVRVEEDWELVVSQPDPNSNSPQITCIISPLSNAESLHAAFELNHQTQPDYFPGGMQLQLWASDMLLEARNFPKSELLNIPGETIRWTQQVRLEGGSLIFEIVNGTSPTWGSFGGQGYLKISVASGLENLNDYNPAVSAGKSGIGFAANRVTKLVLKEIRLYSSAKMISRDSDVKVVHEQQSP